MSSSRSDPPGSSSSNNSNNEGKIVPVSFYCDDCDVIGVTMNGLKYCECAEDIYALIAESISKIKLKADKMNGKVDVKISVSPIYPVKTDDLNDTTITTLKKILPVNRMRELRKKTTRIIIENKDLEAFVKIDHPKQNQTLDGDMVMFKEGAMQSILGGEVLIGGETFESRMKREFLEECAKKWDETPWKFIKF